MKVMNKESRDEACEPSPYPVLAIPQPSLSVALHDLLLNLNLPDADCHDPSFFSQPLSRFTPS